MSHITTEQNCVIKILGWTDDVTTCEHCGRFDLKGTLVCERENGDISYLGSVCGAHAYRWGRAIVASEVRKHAAELERVAREADHQRARAAYLAYLAHPLYLQAQEVYKQREALKLRAGPESLRHPLTQLWQDLERQAKEAVMAEFGVKRVGYVG